MKRLLGAAVAVLFLALLAPFVVVILGIAAQPAAAGGFGAVVFRDDFTGSTLGKAWSVFTGNNDQTGPRSPQNVTVHDGLLDLAVQPQAGEHSAWGSWTGASVCACTASVSTYGRYTVRAMSTGGAGFRSVALTWPVHGNGWPPELDFHESTDAASDSVTTHYRDPAKPRNDGQDHGPRESVDVTAWHDYTVEWTPALVTYLLDGTQVATSARIPTVPMWLGLTAAMHGSGVHPASPQHYLVDSVEVDSYDPGAAAGGGALSPGSVPAIYVAALQAAGSICTTASAPLLAAQIQQESGWNPRAVSPAGAEGLSQFMPGTWSTWGRDVNSDGTADPFDPIDAIDAQGRYDCALAAQVSKVPADPVSLMLAAYNAGPARVLAAGGIPPIPETQNYVRAILALVPNYTAAGGTGSTPARAAVLQLARALAGTPYLWGGTTPAGFDCSGYTGYVFLHAAAVTLPRTAAEQHAFARPVSNPQPGDLVFFGNPVHHVGIYLGNGQMISSPHTGSSVRVEPVWSDVIGYGQVLP